MLLSTEEFCSRVGSALPALVDELQERTGRYGAAEAGAWKSSLPRLARVLEHEALKGFHLHIRDRGSLSIEYRLPASGSWIDAAVLGRINDKPSAVIVEMKDWDTTGDKPGPRSGLINHKGQLVLHPSEQVRGYVDYCRGFHSAVLETQANVEGCVFMTGTQAAPAYSQPPHHDLVAEMPIFTMWSADVADRLPSFLADRLSEPDPDFATRFERGRYQQDRNLVLQIARSVEDPETSPFVLLDAQREGFEHCLAHIDQVVEQETGKGVLIIEGPPGSGKSVLAAHLWSRLIEDERIEEPVVLTSTSSSQKHNWKALFQKAAHLPAAEGVVVPSNQYKPAGLTPMWVKREREKGHEIEVKTWRQNLEHYRGSGGFDSSPDNAYGVSIVDEAHALIDATVPGKQGIPTSGWVHHAGPQAWHIMRSSRVSIFLMDSDQSYRDNETTTRARIEDFASEFGVPEVHRISLAGAQFRCGGSTEYMNWLDSLFDFSTQPGCKTGWRAEDGGPFIFNVVDDPGQLDEKLRAHYDDGASVRLLASYARKWVTKKEPSPHSLPHPKKDFCLEYQRDGADQKWARIWNYAPKEDYTLFVQAPEGSRMADDPLCEVGCPYVVRGFDYDYVGVLWMSGLVWRGRWIAQPDNVFETAWKSTLAAAKKEQKKGIDGPATGELIERMKRAYRILLSRPIRGLYVWFEDKETRDYVESQLYGVSG
jgi:DUF2075 family protein